MGIVKRLTAIIASGFSLAATPEAQAWKTPHPLGPDRPTPGVSAPLPPPDQPRTTAALQPPTVAREPREMAVFAWGFALAAAAVAAAVGVWMLVAADLSPVSGKPDAGVVPPPAAAQASARRATCPLAPATTAASEKDGRFPLQANLEGLIVADITSFISIGNQAAAAGQPRDAEAAFMMACRLADRLKGAASVESADAKYYLGAHYARLALGGAAAGAARAELLKRAEPLYEDSLQTSISYYGENHDKSRLAAEGLAALRQTLAQGQDVKPAPAPAPPPKVAQAPVTAPAPPPKPAPALAPSPTPKPAPAPTPTPAPAIAPAIAPAPAPSTAQAQQRAPPPLAPPVASTAPAVRILPPTDAQSKTRPRSPIVKECLPAVATLGLCDPGP